MKTFKIKIKTPFWTGNVAGKSDTLIETGLLGSIRWWTESVLRGMGYFVCDPVDDSNDSKIKKCPLNSKEGDNESYCISCLIFGATGLKRSFKFVAAGGGNVFKKNLYQ